MKITQLGLTSIDKNQVDTLKNSVALFNKDHGEELIYMESLWNDERKVFDLSFVYKTPEVLKKFWTQ